MKRTVSEFTMKYAEGDPVRFHMPGHKGRAYEFEKHGFGGFIRDIVGQDITEIPGADVLHQPESSIRRVMDNYADLYGVKHVNLLVNGSSAGVMSAILSSVSRGGGLIMERGSHKSAFSALRLGSIQPAYIRQDVNDRVKNGMAGAVTADEVRQALVENPDAEAVFITSPNYFGELAPVSRIANLVHSMGKLLIVDEAHGAHLKFFDEAFGTRTAAESQGADIVIMSTHKTLFSFTGSALMLTCTDAVDTGRLENILSMLQTTSPSYLLMDSLDVNEKIMRKDGREIVTAWNRALDDFCKRAERLPGLDITAGEPWERSGRYVTFDRTKISISLADSGLSGEELQDALIRRNIWPEMVYGDCVLLMTGAGNEPEDFSRLYRALSEIEKGYSIKRPRPLNTFMEMVGEVKPKMAEIPDQYEMVPLYDAAGRILYDSIIPFPPGVPLVCPGEIIDENVISAVMKAAAEGMTVLGLDEEGCVAVGLQRT